VKTLPTFPFYTILRRSQVTTRGIMGNGPSRPPNYGERKPTQLCGEWTSQNGQSIELRLGDITMEDTTAIVNAANNRLQHGSGVAGAISTRGGPKIQADSNAIIKKQKEVKTGKAVCTKGYWLWARHVIHAVGPTWAGGKKGEPEELVEAVKSSLILAERHEWESIAIPAISSGIFGFPKDLCAELMFTTVMDWFDANPQSHLRLVRFTNFDKPTVIVFQKEYEKRIGPLDDSLKLKEDPPKKKSKQHTGEKQSAMKEDPSYGSSDKEAAAAKNKSKKPAAAEDGKSNPRDAPASKDEAEKHKDKTSNEDEKPASEDEKPASEDKKSISEDEKPASEDEKPASEDKKPASEDEKPASEDEKPASEDEKPASEDKKPASENEKPASEDEKPASENEKPASENEKPASENETPASENEKPASEDEKPALEDEKPALEDEKPASEDEKPASEDEKPALEDEKPAPEDKTVEEKEGGTEEDETPEKQKAEPFEETPSSKEGHEPSGDAKTEE